MNAASGGGVVGLSPPPTAGGGVASGGLMGVVGGGHVVRNNQLPPLEIGGGTTGIPIPTGMKPTFYLARCHGGTCPVFLVFPSQGSDKRVHRQKIQSGLERMWYIE